MTDLAPAISSLPLHLPVQGEYPHRALFATVTQEDIVTIDRPDSALTVSPITISPLLTELSLGLTLEVNVVRSKRTRCPRCDQRRVLYHLAAWSKGSPAGTGAALCAECAGFRA